MSRENLERVERLTREWAAGNWSGGAELIDPDVVLTARVPEGNVISEGQEAIRRFMREFLDQWERYWIDPAEFIDLGDKILASGHQYGIGTTSGIKTEETWHGTFTFRDDRVVAMSITPDREEAFKAVGLEE
jgi:ketosteroid isomerase-like protein